MTLRVLLAPASCGKTSWAVSEARMRSKGLSAAVTIVVPSHLQVQDLSKRLAGEGGSLGVSLATINELAREVIAEAGIYPTLLSETAQSFVAKATAAGLPLEYFAGIKEKPGFIWAMLGAIRELKSGGISPEEFIQAVHEIGGSPRLIEIARFYQAFQKRLVQNNWCDQAGEIWLAAHQLEEEPALGSEGKVLIFDGFDDLTPQQQRLIFALAEREPDVYLTLTGDKSDSRAGRIHKRFQSLLEDLLCHPGVLVEELTEDHLWCSEQNAVAYLKERLFLPGPVEKIDAAEEILMTAVPDRESEVRAALRWMKSLIRENKVKPGKTGLMMRNVEPYRAVLQRVMREYDLPMQIVGGIPLAENPAMASLLKALRLAAAGRDGLAWQEVVEIWRSPYFNWRILYDGRPLPYSLENHLDFASRLAQIANWGRVIQGYQQWEEVFELLMAGEFPGEDLYEERVGEFTAAPLAQECAELWEVFCNFVDVLTPPEGSQTVETYTAWVEGLLESGDADQPSGLGILLNIAEGPTDYRERDWRAMHSFKTILRERLWASELLAVREITFSKFYADLERDISQHSYQPQAWDMDGIVCGDIADVRGLSFDAVALIGLAEGEFPAVVKEDPFIRDQERSQLIEISHLPIQISTESAEEEFFFEAVARSTRYLMFTRPRIADNSAPWLASPFWDEVMRVLETGPRLETSRTLPNPDKAGSLGEYLECIAARPDSYPKGWKWAADQIPELFDSWQNCAAILDARIHHRKGEQSVFDGGLAGLGKQIGKKYPGGTVWSASRLESYQVCPFYFFVSSTLGLEKVEPPAEGLDARQLGNIYHRILEQLYSGEAAGLNIPGLLDRLPRVAKEVFDQAPAREGFRVTAWWRHTQREILDNIRRTVIVVENIDPDFKFYRAEQRFGIGKGQESPLEVSLGEEGSYLLRGFIDRVDINGTGEIRIIDYKTSSPVGFDKNALEQGKKLQLPLYALAAQQALELGPVQEGFYFHLRSAQPSSLQLSTYQEAGRTGPEAAMAAAAKHGWTAIRAIDEACFEPKPPAGGCPAYCPAAEFCWHFNPGQW
jgi:ATP-dependent helicase/DNAse subunit B